MLVADEPIFSSVRYEFLGPNWTFPIIFYYKLKDAQLKKLLRVLQKHRCTIGYIIDDIKGISSSFCIHYILLDDKHRLCRIPQHCLSPNMQEVVKKKVVKPLNVGIICAISNSDWVCPVQVLPKRGGIMVIKNEKDELSYVRTIIKWQMYIDYRNIN